MSGEIIDKSREGLTLSKGLHFFRILFSKEATKVLSAYEKFEDIDFDNMIKIGKKGIILDIDECVAPHHGNILPNNISKIKELINGGWKIVVFSNMKKTSRYEELEMFGIKVITSKYAKPDPRGFEESAKELGLEIKEIIMIGDNYLTDGGCKYAGIDFIKVKPISEGIHSKGIGRLAQLIFRNIADGLAANFYNTLNYKK